MWPGGGSTDIRYENYTETPYGEFASLRTRIMVAAGGGGASYYYSFGNGGYGGTTLGGNGFTASTGMDTTSGSVASTGAEQTRGGINGSGGRGGFGRCTSASGRCGGGNGYFAGGAGGHSSGWVGCGSGGSSFISGHSSCSAITATSTANNITFSGHNHFSGMVFTNMSWAAGNQSMPNPRGNGTITGNTGHGYARIIYTH